MTPPLETPSDSHNPSSEPLSFEPSREILDKHEASNLRSSILEIFQNRFDDLTDLEISENRFDNLTDEDAAIFIELLSYFNDSAKLTTLREEFKNYEGDATPKDWIRILAQEIPLEQLRANEVIQAKASYLIKEIEGLAPLQGSLESMAEAHRESMEQKRAAVLPQAEEYCSLYFSDADASVRDRAKANIVQLLLDGYRFEERIQHISGGPIVMSFSNPQKARHLFLYPNGEVSPFLPGRRGSRTATPDDTASSTTPEATQSTSRSWDNLTDEEKEKARIIANSPWDDLTDEDKELGWLFVNSPEANHYSPDSGDPHAPHHFDEGASDEDYIPQPGEYNVVPQTDTENETSLQEKEAFLADFEDIKENPPSTDDTLIKESEDSPTTSAPPSGDEEEDDESQQEKFYP